MYFQTIQSTLGATKSFSWQRKGCEKIFKSSEIKLRNSQKPCFISEEEFEATFMLQISIISQYVPARPKEDCNDLSRAAQGLRNGGGRRHRRL